MISGKWLNAADVVLTNKREQMPTRADAYRLMTSHVKNENLQKHMLAVEVAMRFYARKYSTHPRNDLLSKALYACDEITGMITATAPITKCHSKRLATILPELIALFGSAA